MQKQLESEDDTADLYFQLASIDRKRILSEIQKEEIHLNEIARRIDMTATEALRQLRRLTEARLLEKMPDGRYRLTPYAKLVLDTSSPLDFISKHREYFADHDAFLLPCEFRARLGELSGAKLATNTVDTMNDVAEMFRGAQKTIDASVMGVELLLDIAIRRLQEGLKVRWLMDESFLPKARLMLRSANKLPEMRHIPRILGQVNVTDRAAMLTIRRNDGSLSYYAFVGEDPTFLRWAGDLFHDQWEKAKPWYP